MKLSWFAYGIFVGNFVSFMHAGVTKEMYQSVWNIYAGCQSGAYQTIGSNDPGKLTVYCGMNGPLESSGAFELYAPLNRFLCELIEQINDGRVNLSDLTQADQIFYRARCLFMGPSSAINQAFWLRSAQTPARLIISFDALCDEKKSSVVAINQRIFSCFYPDKQPGGNFVETETQSIVDDLKIESPVLKEYVKKTLTALAVYLKWFKGLEGLLQRELTPFAFTKYMPDMVNAILAGTYRQDIHELRSLWVRKIVSSDIRLRASYIKLNEALECLYDLLNSFNQMNKELSDD